MTTLVEWVVLGLAVVSVFFSLVAVVGFYRLPDVYSRAHAASKSETLGALFGLTATAIVFAVGGDASATLKVGLLALFVLVTGPTAAHAIARAAIEAGIEPWTRATATDEQSGTTPAFTDGGRDRSPAVGSADSRDPDESEADR